MRKEKINIYIIIIIASVLFLSLNCKPKETSEGKAPEKKTTDGKKSQDWKNLIKSGTEDERTLARRIVLDNRKETIEHLLNVLNSPVAKGEQFNNYDTSRNIAIFLLRKLRAKEAVTDLTKWLIPKPGQSEVVSEPRMFSPAGYALVEIGLPSVPPLVELLKSEGNARLLELYIKIIVAIKGVRETEILLEDMLVNETNSPKIENLKATQDLLKEPKYREIFENVYKKVNQLE